MRQEIVNLVNDLKGELMPSLGGDFVFSCDSGFAFTNNQYEQAIGEMECHGGFDEYISYSSSSKEILQPAIMIQEFFDRGFLLCDGDVVYSDGYEYTIKECAEGTFEVPTDNANKIDLWTGNIKIVKSEEMQECDDDNCEYDSLNDNFIDSDDDLYGLYFDINDIPGHK